MATISDLTAKSPESPRNAPSITTCLAIVALISTLALGILAALSLASAVLPLAVGAGTLYLCYLAHTEALATPSGNSPTAGGGQKQRLAPIISSYQIGNATIELHENSDITTVPSHFIVNAANEGMLGGGGVDGAIGKAGGVALQFWRNAAPYAGKNTTVKCPTGEARFTDAGNLPGSVCIHAVGPRGTQPNASDLLRQTYRSVFQMADDCLAKVTRSERLAATDRNPECDALAKKHQDILVEAIAQETPISISFPTISTGIFGFSKPEGCLIFQEIAQEYVRRHGGNPPVKIIRVIFTQNQADAPLYKAAWDPGSSS